MISKTIGYNGVHDIFRQTHVHVQCPMCAALGSRAIWRKPWFRAGTALQSTVATECLETVGTGVNRWQNAALTTHCNSASSKTPRLYRWVRFWRCQKARFFAIYIIGSKSSCPSPLRLQSASLAGISGMEVGLVAVWWCSKVSGRIECIELSILLLRGWRKWWVNMHVITMY